MKNNKLRILRGNIAIVILLVIVVCSCSTKRNVKFPLQKKEFTNRSIVPLIEDCADNNSKTCFRTAISEMILKEAMAQNVILDQDTVEIGLRVKDTGQTYLLWVKSSNDSLYNVSRQVLTSLEDIQPGYSIEENKYVTLTHAWCTAYDQSKITSVDFICNLLNRGLLNRKIE